MAIPFAQGVRGAVNRAAKGAERLHTAVNLLRRPVQYLTEQGRGRDAFWMDLPAAPRTLVLFAPGDVKTVFADDGSELHAGPFNRTLSAFLGEQSVLMVDGPSHMRKRKLLLPPLHGERMHAYGQTMIDTTAASVRDWPLDKTFAIHPRMQRIALEVIVRTVLGFEAGGSEWGRRLADVEELLHVGAWSPLLLPVFRQDLGAHSPWGKFVRLSASLDRALLDDIELCRNRGTAGRTDILALLVDARDEDGAPMPDEEIRDELVTLLVAGHETTATALAWTFHALLDNPATLKRLVDELNAGPADVERYAKLEYLDAVVREGLRLRPIVPFIGRMVLVPRRFGNIDVSVGRGVAVSIFLLHRRPELYPDPETFRPERFIERKFAPWEFAPFGGGIRRCIGMAFALYEMKMVLATVLRDTKLELESRGPLPVVRRSITFAPKGGVRVRRVSG